MNKQDSQEQEDPFELAYFTNSYPHDEHKTTASICFYLRHACNVTVFIEAGLAAMLVWKFYLYESSTG